ncbi:type VII secretion target [Nocardia brasiliensis]|uniref:type VII secretion target n=1 Tax=Nocardia brasiliensis TaxID=37326 RepID=UPI002454919C|nr:type VII secretion target [Nocardia brasiliensis]
MTNPQVRVVTDDLRKHAAKIEGLMGTLTKAVEAAGYLGNVDDGYGWMIRSVVHSLLDDNNRGAVEAIGKAAGETAELPAKLGTSADKFDEWDKTWARTLDELRAAIAGTQQGR